jgi:hypothetical protein
MAKASEVNRDTALEKAVEAFVPEQRPTPVMTKEGQDAVQKAAEQVRDNPSYWSGTPNY